MKRSQVKPPRSQQRKTITFLKASSLFSCHVQDQSLKINKKRFKNAKKIFKKRYKMDQQETFPMDFQGAASGDGVIYFSSDEDDAMECRNFCSMMDVLSSSEDEDVDSEEIILKARCKERQLMEPILIPGPSRKQDTARVETPRPFLLPYHTVEQVYSYGRGNGPIARDGRVKTNHSINVCRELIPQVDTPLSPPPEDRWGNCSLEMPTYGPSSTTSSLE